MSEDPHQSPDESEAPEPREQPEAPSASERPIYPPPPEFYAQPQFTGPDPYGAPDAGYSVPPDAAPAFPFPPKRGDGYGYEPPPRARPLPLKQAIRELPSQYRRVFFQPGPRTFAAEQDKAEWGIIWVQLLLIVGLDLLAALINILTGGISASATLLNSSEASSAAYATLISQETTIAVFVTPLIFLATFFATVGIQYLLARAFRGSGTFKQQAYNQLLFQVPLSMISVAISWIISPLSNQMTHSLLAISNPSTQLQTPILSPVALIILLLLDLFVLALSIYSVVLNVFSIMAVHRLAGGKASAAVLIPYAVLFVLFMLVFCGLVFIGLLAAASLTH